MVCVCVRRIPVQACVHELRTHVDRGGGGKPDHLRNAGKQAMKSVQDPDKQLDDRDATAGLLNTVLTKQQACASAAVPRKAITAIP